MRTKTKQRKDDFFDDGRVIAPMGEVRNPYPMSFLSPRAMEKQKKRSEAVDDATRKYVATNESAPMSKKEQRIFSRSMMLAYLSAVLVVVGGFALILLLFQYAWFK